jgi:Zn-dependent protease with chaperone function
MNESRAARYQRLRRRAEAVSGAAGGLLLIVCAATPAGDALAGWARARTAGFAPSFRGAMEVVLYVGALAIALELLALPVMLFVSSKRRASSSARPTAVDDSKRRASSSARPTAIDDSKRRASSSARPTADHADSVGRAGLEARRLLSAQLHAATFGVVAAVIVGIVVHLAARETGGWWWLTTGVALSAILAAAVRGISTLIARSGDAKPLENAELRARLAAIAESAHVPVAGIFEWRAADEVEHTASVTGFGRGRRVLIAPEVLREWSTEEITVVVAHELSHHKHHDLIQTLAVDALLMSTALAFADVILNVAGVPPSSLPALPLIALSASAVWLAVTPARHALSRWQERRADQFALAMTGEADAFAAAVRRVGERNLIEDRPDTLTRWFFHRHPTIEERLAMAGKRL